MISQWTTHLKDPQDKERFEASVQSSRHVFERLTEMLDDRLAAIEQIQTGVDIYKQPGWDALQAYYNGSKATIKLVKNLINLDQKELYNGNAARQ